MASSSAKTAMPLDVGPPHDVRSAPSAANTSPTSGGRTLKLELTGTATDPGMKTVYVVRVTETRKSYTQQRKIKRTFKHFKHLNGTMRKVLPEVQRRLPTWGLADKLFTDKNRQRHVFIDETLDILNSVRGGVAEKVAAMFANYEFSDKTVLEYDVPEHPESLQHACRCEGFLVKQGSFMPTWKRRWFKLYDDRLYYFKAKGDSTQGDPEGGDGKPKKGSPIGCLRHIDEASVFPINARDNAFAVITPYRTLLLSAETGEDMRRWMAELLRLYAENEVGKASFEWLSVIGRGKYGKVVLARKKDTKKLYAIKIFKREQIKSSGQMKNTLLERSILSRVCHPFVVGIHYAFQTETRAYMALDYCPGGEFFHYLRRAKRLREEHAAIYIAEVVLALEYLHRMNIIYRDLKPENILIDEEGHVRLTDFGLSKESTGFHTYTICGTPEFMAPEILQKQGYSDEVDCWALGVLLYEMLVGKHPFYHPNQMQMYNNIIYAQPHYPEDLSTNAKSLLVGLMHKVPYKRCGAGGISEVKAHPFFECIDWDEVYQRKAPVPWKPDVEAPTDVSNFDDFFTREKHVDSVVSEEDAPKIPWIQSFNFNAEKNANFQLEM